MPEIVKILCYTPFSAANLISFTLTSSHFVKKSFLYLLFNGISFNYLSFYLKKENEFCQNRSSIESSIGSVIDTFLVIGIVSSGIKVDPMAHF